MRLAAGSARTRCGRSSATPAPSRGRGRKGLKIWGEERKGREGHEGVGRNGKGKGEMERGGYGKRESGNEWGRGGRKRGYLSSPPPPSS